MEKVKNIYSHLLRKIKKFRTNALSIIHRSHSRNSVNSTEINDTKINSLNQDALKSAEIINEKENSFKEISVDSMDKNEAKINPLKRITAPLFKHKFIIGGVTFTALLILFMAVAIYRGYFLTSANIAQPTTSESTTISKTDKDIASNTQKPSLAAPSPSDNPSPSESVLGTSDDSSSDETSAPVVSPSVEISPIPTEVPIPTATPDDSSNDTSSSSNSSCTTAAGVPNSWYSDVYPNPPVSTNNGSITLIANIRDCNINNVSSSSTLKISLNSGDPNTQVNGQSLPTTVTTQNGQASFTVSSQVDGVVSLTVDDTTDSFDVTDTSNNNPSITFSGSSSTPTPTDAISPSPTQSISPSPTSTIAPTP